MQHRWLVSIVGSLAVAAGVGQFSSAAASYAAGVEIAAGVAVGPADANGSAAVRL